MPFNVLQLTNLAIKKLLLKYYLCYCSWNIGLVFKVRWKYDAETCSKGNKDEKICNEEMEDTSGNRFHHLNINSKSWSLAYYIKHF